MAYAYSCVCVCVCVCACHCRGVDPRALSREEKARLKELQRAEKARLKQEKTLTAAVRNSAPDDMDALCEDRAELQRLTSGGLSQQRPGMGNAPPMTAFLGSSAELAERVAQLKLWVDGPAALPVSGFIFCLSQFAGDRDCTLVLSPYCPFSKHPGNMLDGA